jgi:ATP-dependent helicase/nuclease subunit A
VIGKLNWTEAQRAAIEARNQNLLVAAGAGSGKTAVLVERIIRLLCDPVRPVDVDRLLVVTFTNAAAAQMRKRIGAAINEALNKDPASERLERQLRLLPQAQITTLHSFCGEVLRRYYYLLDLDPEFRVANEIEAAILRQETLAAVIEEHYREIDKDPAFRFLVESYGGERDDLKLQKLVLRLYHFARSNPWPEDWLARAAHCGLTDGGLDGEGPLAAALRDLVRLKLQLILYELQMALRLTAVPGGATAYGAILQEEAAAVEALVARAAGDAWEDLRAGILGFDFAKRLPRVDAAAVDPELKDRCGELRKRARDRFRELRAHFFSRAPGELLGDLAGMAPAMRRLVQLTAVFGEAYRRAKLDRNLVDFGDLEHYCLRVLLAPDSAPGRLHPSAVAAEYRKYFAEVLVDEYQDINMVQEAILQLVSRPVEAGPNLFLVGDVKQSIYRFRLAEPELFLKKYREYPPEDGVSSRRIDLIHNFRSRPGIVDAVNYIFRRIMTPVVGEMEYDRVAELVCGQKPPSSGGAEPVQVHLLERRPAETDAPSGEQDGEPAADTDTDVIQREARLVAGIIRRLVSGTGSTGPAHVRDPDTGGARPIRYRDIVVLLRATAGKANTYLEEFRRLDIPAHAKTGTGYFEATEVATVLALLKVIDNPRQDIPLAAVLRSPIVGLRAADLAEIRLAHPDGDFYQAAAATAEKGGSLGEKLSCFLANLERWRTQARQGSLANLIWTVYRETGYYDYAGAMPGGAERQANLRALHDRARQYEATTFRGLFRFLRFLELLREGGQDLGPAPVLAETEDVVRVMSIHQSKGLEFPVVILADLGRRFYTSDLNRDVLFHKDLGLGPLYVDPEARVSYPTVAWHALRERLHLEQLAEEMRILYVGMTRARDRLILTGSVAGLDEALARWGEVVEAAEDGKLPVPALAEARSFLDWLVPVLAAHSDAEALRRCAGRVFTTGVPVSDPSRWEVHLHRFDAAEDGTGAGRPAAGETLERLRLLEPVPAGDPEAELQVAGVLSWNYPRPLLFTLPAKVTATEVKRRFDTLAAAEETDRLYRYSITRRPRFLQVPRGLSGAEYGAAVHLVLQLLELEGDLSTEGIREQIADMESRELLTAAEAAAIDASALARFFAGPLGGRLVRAGWVRRELPFYLIVPARELYPEEMNRRDSCQGVEGISGCGSGEEPVVVQGIIDCLFAEPDGLVLIDYKTDQVAPGREAELTDRYRSQLNLYSRAVESILNARVKERYLYLFATGSVLAI